jgi:hypothetical protein
MNCGKCKTSVIKSCSCCWNRCKRCCAEIDYKFQHSTRGCRITHMFGVPLILLSIPTAFASAKLASAMVTLGWFLQLGGHIVYEQNFPSVVNTRSLSWTLLAAVKSAACDWKKFVTTGTLLVLLLVGSPANAEPEKKKLWLPLRVARAVLLIPFRIPAYLRDVHDEVEQGIALRRQLRCYRPLYKIEEPDSVASRKGEIR